MSTKKMRTTFSKLTLSFVLFGLLPILLIVILGFFKYSDISRETMISNYMQIDDFFAKNVSQIIEDVDEALSGMYDYDISDPNEMVQGIRDRSIYISGVRLVDNDDNLYFAYKNQEKVLNKESGIHTNMSIMAKSVEPRDRMILSATEESNICLNSDDFIFTISRNYMDISTVKSAIDTPVATIFADINVETIDAIVEDMNLSKGQCYVYDMTASRFIYSRDTSMYLDGVNPLLDVQSRFVGKSGYVKIDNVWYFYSQIQDSNVYAIVTAQNNNGMDSSLKSRILLIIVFVLASILLLAMNLWFSERMSEPPRKLKKAMEQVTAGDMTARVEVNTNDEMQYIADGFNNMVEKLSEYIDQVYKSEIYRKDAELNALKMQIKPHYLYNTLDVIRMVALDEDADKTAELLECLAHQLRYVMGQHSERITIKDEIEMLREYFVIMRVRYENKITLVVQLEEKDENLLIPKMLLQPVVENAIRHGLREKAGNGAVSIQVKRRENEIEIIIMDDGIGMDEETLALLRASFEAEEDAPNSNLQHSSVGMRNVFNRIKMECGKKYGFTVDSVKGMGTIITYHLPVEEE